MSNYEYCSHECGGLPPDYSHHCDHACNDILESVALMQTGLSHIINAEGEKIQKVIGTTQNIDKLLCVNKSVNETVINVTHLEMVLHSKLATIQEFCGRKVKNYDRLSSDNVCDCVDGDKS